MKAGDDLPKITISVPEGINSKAENLRSYFGVTSNSAVYSLGIEILRWIEQEATSNATIVSFKKTADSKYNAKAIPLLKVQENSSKSYDFLMELIKIVTESNIPSNNVNDTNQINL